MRRPFLGCEPCEARVLLESSIFQLSIADAPPVQRPLVGTVDATFTVTLEPINIEETVSVYYQTMDGTARAADGDYVPTSGTLIFSPGEVSQTILVQIPASNLPLPPTQTFFVDLSNPQPEQSVTITDHSATGTILNFNPLVVTTTADSGPGSLRNVINYANTIPDPSPGGDPSPQDPVIIFAIPGEGPYTITPTSPLPSITRSVTVDATTQRGYVDRPIVELSGAGLTGPVDQAEGEAGPVGLVGGPVDGLVVLAGASTIRGFAVNRFPGSGIVLHGLGKNRVVGNLLGTDLGGTTSLGNGVNGLLIQDSPDNTIGGDNQADGNVISGNGSTGVRIEGAGATRNVILGNKIGTDRSGLAALPNVDDGVFLNGAPGNTIGGLIAGAGNLISGNGSVGVQVFGASASGNLIQGNRIGTDFHGQSALPNLRDGVFINDAPNNVVGGTDPSGWNLISGNGSVGVQILGANASGNTVQGNRIGTNLGGTSALPNARDGVFINEAPGNLIGGTIAGAGNLISGNLSVGVQVFGAGSRSNVVQGNRIGTNADGLAALPNARDGVFVNNAPQTLVGGGASGAGNLISGNLSVGVQVLGNGSAGSALIGNLIGVNVGGQAPLPNNYGVFLNGAAGITTSAAAIQGRNIVRSNRVAQVFQTVGYPTRATVRLGAARPGSHIGASARRFSRHPRR